MHAALGDKIDQLRNENVGIPLTCQMTDVWQCGREREGIERWERFSPLDYALRSAEPHGRRGRLEIERR